MSSQLAASSSENERLPTHGATDSEHPVQSPESFHPWYRKNDAIAVTVGNRENNNFAPGFSGINEGELLDLQKNAVGPHIGRFCFTLETHLKLDYDISPDSPNPTVFKVAGDDSVWVFVNGHLVADLGGGASMREFTLRDYPEAFPENASTGTCDVAIFYAEQYQVDGSLHFHTNAPMRPIYAYQVVADTAPNLVPSFSLLTAPAGLLIGPTGKIFWDYSDAPSGIYPVEVQVTSGYGNSAVQAFTITVDQDPLIVTPPQNQSVRTGEIATFYVAASGTGIVYQWLKGEDEIPGATGHTLSLTDVQPSAAGSYSVRITNPHGIVTSTPVTLVVNNEPYIISGPESVSINVGQAATFSVVAGGTSLSYQWFELIWDTWQEIPLQNQTTSSLHFPTTTSNDAGTYFVRITNADGSTDSWWTDLYFNQ